MSTKAVEQSVLGACMEAPAVVEIVRAILPAPDRFSDPRHQVIYAALIELAERGDPTDTQALKDHLEQTGNLARAGGPLYLIEVNRAGEIPTDPTYQARIVAREAAGRRIAIALDRGQTWMRNPAHRDDMPGLLAAIRDEVDQALAEVTGDAPPTRPGGWGRVDLTGILDGSYQPPMPTVGARDDGVGLFYPGRGHSIAAESEAGKSWLALTAVLHEIERGRGAVYVDFEDDAAGVVGRLLAMNAKPDDIRDRFGYIRPDSPLTAAGSRAEFTAALGDLRPSLVIIDGVTEGMTLHGLDPLGNKDVAEFGRLLIRPAKDCGAAAVTLDHVTKDREGRGRYAIGAVHKLNGIDGAAYMLENRNPFGIGITGRSTVYIAKDRPAQLRRHALPSQGLHWFADLVLTSHDATFAEVSLSVPNGREEAAQTLARRTREDMVKISRVLAETPGLSKAAIEGAVGGRRENVRLALETLIAKGYVRGERQGNATRHVNIRPYEGE